MLENRYDYTLPSYRSVFVFILWASRCFSRVKQDLCNKITFLDLSPKEGTVLIKSKTFSFVKDKLLNELSRSFIISEKIFWWMFLLLDVTAWNWCCLQKFRNGVHCEKNVEKCGFKCEMCEKYYLMQWHINRQSLAKSDTKNTLHTIFIKFSIAASCINGYLPSSHGGWVVRAVALQSLKTAILLRPRFKSHLGLQY